MVTVALIGGTDVQTRTIVEDVLESLAIPSVMEGSAAYGVQVSSQHRQRATAALRAEPRLAGHWIQFLDEPER
jgi:hypothetical protein